MPNKVKQLLTFLLILVVPLVVKFALTARLGNLKATLIALGIMVCGALISMFVIKPQKEKPDDN